MKTICISLIMICCLTSIAQDVCFQIDLNSKTNDIKQINLYVSTFENGISKNVLSKNINVRTNINELVEIPETSGEGIYLISIDNQNYFEVILTYDEMPTLKGSLQDLIDGSILINNSIENEVFYKYLSISLDLNQSAYNVRDKRLALKSIDKIYYTKQKELELELFNLQSAYNKNLELIQTSSPHTFTSNFIIPITKLPIPSQEQLKLYETNDAYLQDYYLNNLHLNSSRFKNIYILRNKLKLYLENYTPIKDEYQKKTIDRILNKANGNSEMIQFLVDFLMNYYYKERRDELVIYVYNKYNSEFCNTEYNDLNAEELIQNLKLNQAGNKIKELYLPDENNNQISLLNIVSQNSATILLFWSADCEVCMKELPFVNNLYNKYRQKKLAVYAVNLDQEKSKWLNVIEEYNLSWNNLNELKPRNQSQVEQTYKVRQTPTIYIIDEEGKIVAKDLFGYELEVAIANYLNYRSQSN